MLLIPEAFCASYQILRSLWLAAGDPRGSALFLVPKENDVLSSELAQVLPLVGAELRARARVVFVEDVLTSLVASARLGNELSWYAALLREKYVP